MTDPKPDDLRPVLRIDFPGHDRLGRGKIELLDHVHATGSISAAGRAMNMSYRRAWLLISDLNRMFNNPVVESQRGGQKGGGAALTAFGKELVQRFRAMENAVNSALASDLAWLETVRDHTSMQPVKGPNLSALERDGLDDGEDGGADSKPEPLA